MTCDARLPQGQGELLYATRSVILINDRRPSRYIGAVRAAAKLESVHDTFLGFPRILCENTGVPHGFLPAPCDVTGR
jgi:hypothetical protein